MEGPCDTGTVLCLCETLTASLLPCNCRLYGLGPAKCPGFAPESFDAVLLDAPCTALGLRPRLLQQQQLSLLLETAAYQVSWFGEPAFGCCRPCTLQLVNCIGLSAAVAAAGNCSLPGELLRCQVQLLAIADLALCNVVACAGVWVEVWPAGHLNTVQ